MNAKITVVRLVDVVLGYESENPGIGSIRLVVCVEKDAA